VAQYTQLCRLAVQLNLKRLHQNKQLNQEKIPFHHVCAKTTQKIPFRDLHRPHSLHGAIFGHTVSISRAAKCDERWFQGHQTHGHIALQTFLETV
jgi:hypothetical protein